MEKSYYKFYRDLGEHFPEEEIVYKTLRGKMRKKFILNYIKCLKGTLLDIGCNKGLYIANYIGGSAVGIDLSSHVLQYVLKRERQSDFPVFCVVGDAEDVNFLKKGTFDHIICSEVLEHVYNPWKVISGIASILKPGGSVLITTPNYKNKKPNYINSSYLEKFGIEGMKDGSYYHTAFKPEEIAVMFAECGLNIVDKGTLEQEVKCSTRIPALLCYTIHYMNKFSIKSRKIDEWNGIVLDLFSQGFYYLARFLQIDSLLKRIYHEGVRSFVIARKPQQV